MSLWWVIPAVTVAAGAMSLWRLVAGPSRLAVVDEPPEIPRYRPNLKAVREVVRDYPALVSTTPDSPPERCAVCVGPWHPAHGMAYWTDPDGVVRSRAWCVLGLRPLLVATVSRIGGGLVIQLCEGE